MFSKVFILLSLAAAMGTANAAIDLTPTVKEYSAEGFSYRQLTFKNEEGGASFIPPQKWIIRGGKTRLQLTPPDKAFVEATIEAKPLPAPQVFDVATVKALEEQVSREVPPGSQSVQLIKREENSVAVSPNFSLEVVISYQVLGRTFHRSVIFVNCPDQQLIFCFTAPKADFVALNPDYRHSVNSWQWIDKPSKVVAQIPATAAK